MVIYKNLAMVYIIFIILPWLNCNDECKYDNTWYYDKKNSFFEISLAAFIWSLCWWQSQIRLRMSECDKYLATFKSPIRRLRHYIISMPAVEHVREIVQYFVNENHPHIMKLILYYLHK